MIHTAPVDEGLIVLLQDLYRKRTGGELSRAGALPIAQRLFSLVYIAKRHLTIEDIEHMEA